MRRISGATLLGAILVLGGPAETGAARPLAPGAGGSPSVVKASHSDAWYDGTLYARPVRPWYYRGFALRLGWGYPAFGYPWGYPAPPTVYVPAPSGIAPAPAVLGAMPPVGTAEWYAYCASKYRSFEPGTGLYTTYSGVKRPCR
jgi:hypothetical protein